MAGVGDGVGVLVGVGVGEGVLVGVGFAVGEGEGEGVGLAEPDVAKTAKMYVTPALNASGMDDAANVRLSPLTCAGPSVRKLGGV